MMGIGLPPLFSKRKLVVVLLVLHQSHFFFSETLYGFSILFVVLKHRVYFIPVCIKIIDGCIHLIVGLFDLFQVSELANVLRFCG